MGFNREALRAGAHPKMMPTVAEKRNASRIAPVDSSKST